MRRILAIAVVALMLSSYPALAGGLILYETGTPEVGLASAGWAARADDAATVLTNPAGMTRVGDNDVLLGLQVLYGGVAFTPDSRTTTTGSDGGKPVGFFPGGGVYYVNPTTEKMRFGVAVAGNFGLGLHYDDNWVGRYYAQDATILGISVLPAFAYKISDSVSIGAALNATYGILDTQIAVNNILPATPDGTLKLSDTTWGFGGNVGILVEAKEGSRFGLTYTSPVKLDFGDTPEFSGLGPGLSAAIDAAGLRDAPLDLSVTIPQTVMASFVHKIDDQWNLLGNVGWQDWSAFGKVDVVVSTDTPTSLTADLNFKDTWHAALGAETKLKSPWTISFGAAYDSSCVDDADRSVTLPVGASWRFGVGARRAMSKKLDLGLAYELAWGGDLPVDQQRGPLAGRVAGAYENSALSFLAVSLRWKL